MAKAIITGVSGFAGSHLADYLLANTDWEITGIHRPGDSTRNLEHSCSRIDIQL
ncbi:MAG: NAD-dependent epimerase/dehydratase family protein, partial [Chloroflexi bacterium]|nr:NAD-dependent epimerase/dehydratase family protein [Chloroflexota bacterium]